MDVTDGATGIVDGHTARSRMRVGDTDRERIAEQLRSAHTEGRLDLTEYDERLQQAWAVRTYGELETLTADLPHVRPPVDPAANREVRQPHWQHRHGRCGRTAVVVWASASVINLLIWVVLALATMSWIYPWWVWVAGPWGVVLLAGWTRERARAHRPAR